MENAFQHFSLQLSDVYESTSPSQHPQGSTCCKDNTRLASSSLFTLSLGTVVLDSPTVKTQLCESNESKSESKSPAGHQMNTVNEKLVSKIFCEK